MKNWLLILSIGFLCGCTNSEDPVYPENQNKTLSSDSFVSLEMALNKLQPFMNAISDGATRSNLKVSSVEIITSQSTRSNSDSTTPYYLVNFGNNEGFAILSSDNRLLPVYAFSNEGSLSLKDTISNKMLASFITSLPTDPTINPLIITDPVQNSGYERLVAPLLTGPMQKIHQASPYNTFTPTCPETVGNHGHYYTGCTPIAMAAYMSFYKFPSKIDNTSIDWSGICNPTSMNYESMRTLLRAISSSNNLCPENNPKTGGRGCKETDITKTFKNLGYTFSSYSAFDYNDIVSVLKSKRPVFLNGENRYEMHNWVLDGLFAYYTLSLSPIVGGSNIKTYTNYYFHCVWGWGGSYNGYFAYSNGMGGTAEKVESNETIENCPEFFNTIKYYKNLSPK